MDALLTTLLIVGLMAATVTIFRAFVRRPANVWQDDAPGLRTIVVFDGKDAEFFADDHEDQPYVGIRLFHHLCDGLTAAGILIESRGTIQNAQRAECVARASRFALVLEWIEGQWMASVEWVPETRAEMRHLALTQQVYAPPDSPALREVLRALHNWLKREPRISAVTWHRKEKWIAEDTSDPSDGPIDSQDN
jgi:hypothetical protein